MKWIMIMAYTNYEGHDVTHWWPIFRSYEECRYFAGLLTRTIEDFNGGHVIYALCNEMAK